MKERKIVLFGLFVGITILWLVGSLVLWICEYTQIQIPRFLIEFVLGAGIMFLGQFIYHIIDMLVKGEIPHEDEE